MLFPIDICIKYINIVSDKISIWCPEATTCFGVLSVRHVGAGDRSIEGRLPSPATGGQAAVLEEHFGQQSIQSVITQLHEATDEVWALLIRKVIAASTSTSDFRGRKL